MLSDFFSKMSKKEKIIFYVAIFFVVAAIFDRLILRIIFNKINSLEESIRAQELRIKKDFKIISQKDVISKQQEQYAQYSSQAKSQEEEISGALKEIEILAGKTQVNLSEIKPTELKAEKLIKRYIVSLSCEGTMEQLINFMFQLEDSKALFSIENYSLASKDKEKGILKASMVISKTVVQ